MKKINETTKELAVRSAEILNEIIKDADEFTATRSEWTKIFSEYKLPYKIGRAHV